ncbi:outer membrane HopK domain protein [Helicobacter pylori CPY1313]|nr:outer membrane HopK domain protein [Helicobacter pylori CPY1313]
MNQERIQIISDAQNKIYKLNQVKMKSQACLTPLHTSTTI